MTTRTFLLTCGLCLYVAVLSSQIRKGDHLLTPAFEPAFTSSIVPFPVADNLGGLYSRPEFVQIFNVNALYGFAVSDDLLVGGQVSFLALFGDIALEAGQLGIFGRYYARNTTSLQAYGGLGAGLLLGDYLESPAAYLEPAVGVGIPLGPSVLFGPELSHRIWRGSNIFQGKFMLAFILGRRTRPENRIRGRYGRGSLMLGTQLGGFSLSRTQKSLRLSPEAYLFLGRRVALGATAGAELRFAPGSDEARYFAGIAGRYFPVQGRRFDVFLHGGFNVESDQNPNNGQGLLVDSRVTIDFGLGGLYFLRQRVALEAGLGVRTYPQFEEAELALKSGVRFFLSRGRQAGASAGAG